MFIKEIKRFTMFFFKFTIKLNQHTHAFWSDQPKKCVSLHDNTRASFRFLEHEWLSALDSSPYLIKKFRK